MWQSDHSLQKTKGAENTQAHTCTKGLSRNRPSKGGHDGPIEVK
jgi:hypothetical protein